MLDFEYYGGMLRIIRLGAAASVNLVPACGRRCGRAALPLALNGRGRPASGGRGTPYGAQRVSREGTAAPPCRPGAWRSLPLSCRSPRAVYAVGGCVLPVYTRRGEFRSLDFWSVLADPARFGSTGGTGAYGPRRVGRRPILPLTEKYLDLQVSVTYNGRETETET